MTINALPAKRADISELSHALGRAFYDDPVSIWIMPDDRSTGGAPAAILRDGRPRHHHLAGGGCGSGQRRSRLSARQRCGIRRDGGSTRLREQLMMMPSFHPRFRIADDSRLHKLNELLEQMKQQHPEEPHWYLAVIGSDTAVRGKGFGQVLMRSRLVRVDAEHAPAYLESSKPENVPYYQRFGFEVTGADRALHPTAAQRCGRCGANRAKHNSFSESSRLSCWPQNVSHIVADVRRGRPGPTPVPAERS